MGDVVVVGSGFGGLSAAVSLAARGRRVVVVEAGERPGGKAGVVHVDGVEMDTGPSVLTLPEILDGVLRQAGTTLADEVTLVRPTPAFRYRWPDGAVVDVHVEVEDTLESVRSALGADAARDLRGFLDYARGIWDAAAPYFVLGDAPTPGAMLRLGPAALAAVTRIDPWRSMSSAIHARVREPHLRDLLLRYATYNGSDPRHAPATLNCIAHVELGLGPWGVEGGMYALVRAFVRVAERLGVEIRCGSPATSIDARGGRITGVTLADGEHLAADAVVCNADVAHLAADLMPRSGLSAPAAPSTSGWTALMRVKRTDRAAHEVLFPRDYSREFVDLFDRAVPPDEPTVYLCFQERAHARTGWADAEPVFVMANAPAEPAGRASPEATWERLRAVVLGRLDGIVQGDVVWERTPTELATRFPRTRGALYGASSNGMTAAFQRPPNRIRAVPGLYLASGSAHPGGGVPLCVSSGRAAAKALLEDM